jgi:D-amino-acid dehydrogenase
VAKIEANGEAGAELGINAIAESAIEDTLKRQPNRQFNSPTTTPILRIRNALTRARLGDLDVKWHFAIVCIRRAAMPFSDGPQLLSNRGRDMSIDVDVLVVGGGSIGVCVAHYLAGQGREVTIVEMGEICSGASYGNAGFIVPSHSVPLASPGVVLKGLKWMLDPDSPFYIKPRFDLQLFRWLLEFSWASRKAKAYRSMPVILELMRSSMTLFQELDKLEDLEFGFEQRGLLFNFQTRKGLEDGLKEADLLRGIGLEPKAFDRAGLQELEPSLAFENIVGGIHYPEDAHLAPAVFVRNLAARAEKRGVKILPLTEVLALETPGKRITAVRTTRGDFAPREVVLAGGAWSPLLVQGMNIRLPIQPAKGYSITTRKPPSCPAIPLALGEAKIGITPLKDTLRFAGTLELAGLNMNITRRRVDAILQAVKSGFPELADAEVLEIWRGQRPCTPDGLPIIGRPDSVENLIIAGGHSMLGVSLGPITGKLVAQIISGEKPEVDLAPMSPARF